MGDPIPSLKDRFLFFAECTSRVFNDSDPANDAPLAEFLKNLSQDLYDQPQKNRLDLSGADLEEARCQLQTAYTELQTRYPYPMAALASAYVCRNPIPPTPTPEPAAPTPPEPAPRDASASAASGKAIPAEPSAAVIKSKVQKIGAKPPPPSVTLTAKSAAETTPARAPPPPVAEATSPPPTPTAKPAAPPLVYGKIKAIFAPESIFNEWNAWVQAIKPSENDLEEYAQTLTEIKEYLGKEKLQKIFSQPLQGDGSKIDVRITKSIPGIADYSGSDAYQGLVLDDNPMERLVNAIWNHGNDYGKGKIGASFVACSKIMSTHPNGNQVQQQIVFDLPTEAVLGSVFAGSLNEDKMTLNDTKKSKYGGLGIQIRWDLIKNKTMQWACHDDEQGTPFSHNTGIWRLIPISTTKTFIWYATESDVDGVDAPESDAIKALRNNIIAFSNAAKGSYGN